ncbi:NAD(P)H-dependent oxidoreductase [Ponticaulis sp.]|uniref:NADPH-dependent FMN reductase n=1 Tax=Ponticaulis sp. TaxID=2020902 RepID=UPI002639C7F8|nr:NAD(P)H-dependent oxidoreductase [Ponticaulis sp.]MDF1681824.1 NAD(P)H-dependent oxidoreductase [Ponticaulis sp.]
MSETFEIAVLVGSLRKESLNRKLAEAMTALAPDGLSFEFVTIGDLPLYNEDLEADVPDAWTRFRDTIKTKQGVLFFTPEYNRSVPGALKNALDVGSRPYGQSVWDKKPAAIVTASPGALAAFGANHHLRQSLVFLNMPTLQQPEAYIGQVNKLLSEDGEIVSDDTKSFLTTFMNAFASWVERHKDY